MNRPLEGMLVIDMSEVMQGPLAAQVLGDYGADVVKIERGNGDLMRGLDRDAVEAGDVSAYFAAVNRNKRSIKLNLKTAEGMRILHQLLSRADVLLHSYRPEGVKRLGISYEDLQSKYPSLVYASASGWGESGPLTHKGGQDLLAQSYSGMARAVSDSSQLAEFNPIATTDFASGMSLAQGVLAALLQRTRSGSGQHVSVNLLDTGMAQQMLEAASLMMYQRELNWVQQWWSGIFETSDGHITVLGFFRDNAVGRACSALGLEEDLSGRDEFSTLAKQAENRAESVRLISPYVRELSTAEAIRRFDEVDLLCSPLFTLEEALEQEQTAVNGCRVEVQVPGQGVYSVLGHHVHMTDVEKPELHSVPLPGQHTQQVLSELGLDAEEYSALRQSGAVG